MNQNYRTFYFLLNYFISLKNYLYLKNNNFNFDNFFDIICLVKYYFHSLRNAIKNATIYLLFRHLHEDLN